MINTHFTTEPHTHPIPLTQAFEIEKKTEQHCRKPIKKPWEILWLPNALKKKLVSDTLGKYAHTHITHIFLLKYTEYQSLEKQDIHGWKEASKIFHAFPGWQITLSLTSIPCLLSLRKETKEGSAGVVPALRDLPIYCWFRSLTPPACQLSPYI